MLNNVVLIGRLTRDPELRYIPVSGRAVTNFTLAVDRNMSKERKAEAEANNQPTADFIRITVWGAQAESSANYLSKGRLVAVQGRIQTGQYVNDKGDTVYTTDVVANNVQFLEWGDRNQSPNQSQYQGGGSMQEGGISGFSPTDPSDAGDIPF